MNGWPTRWRQPQRYQDHCQNDDDVKQHPTWRYPHVIPHKPNGCGSCFSAGFLRAGAASGAMFNAAPKTAPSETLREFEGRSPAIVKVARAYGFGFGRAANLAMCQVVRTSGLTRVMSTIVSLTCGTPPDFITIVCLIATRT